MCYQEFLKYLEYNPEEDIQITAAAVASAGQIHSQELASSTGLSPGRLNRAVEYLADYRFVDRSENWNPSFHICPSQRDAADPPVC